MVRRTGMPRIIAAAACGLSLLSACSPAAEPTNGSGTPSAAPPAVPTGAAPAVPHVAGRWYVTPDRRLRLPGGRRGVTGAVVYDDGLLVADATTFEGTVGLARVRDGRWASREQCSSGVPAVSADGRFVAWATTLCPESGDTSVGAIHRARASGGSEVVLPVGAGLVSVVGFLGRRIVYNLGFVGGAWTTDLASAPRRIPGIAGAADVSPRGLVIGYLRDGTTGVVARPDGTVLWRSASGLTSFSPEGTRVLAGDSGGLTVLRARDGADVASLGTPGHGEVGEVVWETERTLLAIWYDGTRTAIVRLGVDGRVERATRWREALPGDASGPYVLLP